jgi:hypothetical protein
LDEFVGVAGIEVAVDPVGLARYGTRVDTKALASDAILARRSNALAKLIIAWRSLGLCISTSEVIGSPSSAVNKFI